MSAALPAPSMIVVFSFSTTIFLASPRSLSVAFSSDRPTSSEITVPPVRIGDVLQHGLAAVAEARRLDGADLQDAADVVDDERRQRFALDVFGDDQQRLPAFATPSSSGSISRMFEIFLSYSRMYGLLELGRSGSAGC